MKLLKLTILATLLAGCGAKAQTPKGHWVRSLTDTARSSPYSYYEIYSNLAPWRYFRWEVGTEVYQATLCGQEWFTLDSAQVAKFHLREIVRYR